MATDCERCPLRRHSAFEKLSIEEVLFIQQFKTGEVVVHPGDEILAEGTTSDKLYSVLSGQGIRVKTTAKGKRQVVGFVLPGDFLGLQSGVMGKMRHTVEATTPMVLCVFDRSALWSLFEKQPHRAFDLTHVTAVEENFLGEAISEVGQLDGMAKICWALHRFFERMTQLDMVKDGQAPLPYRQKDLADALGLSLVHTNKTLAKLRDKGVATWQDSKLTVHNAIDLARMAQATESRTGQRPLI